MPVMMKIDFYQVNLPVSFGGTFKGVCETVGSLTGRKRNLPVPDAAVARLQKIFFEDNIVEGDLIRLKMNLLPVKANLDGKITDFDLEDDEGVADQTAFLFDPQTKILLLQRNRSGVGSNMFARYFEEKGGVSEAIALLPLIKMQAMKRLAKFNEVTKIHVAIARPSPTGRVAIASDGGSLNSFLGMMEQLQAPHAQFDLSVGRQRGSLLMANTLAVIKQAVSMSHETDATVTKIVVNGKNEDDETEILDILKDRVVHQVKVDPDRKRRIKYAMRRRMLKQAWLDRKDEVALYGDN